MLLFLIHCLLGLTKAARDTKRFARDPRGVGRSEKDRSGSNVLGLANATERRLCFNAFAKIALVEAGGAHPLGYHHPGVDGIDADFARTELLGQCSGDGIDRAFCPGVNRRTRRRQ